MNKHKKLRAELRRTFHSTRKAHTSFNMKLAKQHHKSLVKLKRRKLEDKKVTTKILQKKKKKYFEYYSKNKRAVEADITDFKGEFEEDDLECIKKESEYYLRNIKVRKEDDRKAKKEREQLRRKIIISQQSVFRELEMRERDMFMVEKILKESIAEKDFTEKLNKTVNWKQVFIDNRCRREELYRKLGEGLEMKRKKLVGRRREMMVKCMEERIMRLKREKKAIEFNERKKDYESNLVICKDIATNDIIKECFDIIDLKDSLEGYDLANKTRINEELKESKVDNYLLSILQNLDILTNPKKMTGEEEKKRIVKSKFKINCCVIGKFYSGASTICKRLSELFNLKVVDCKDTLKKENEDKKVVINDEMVASVIIDEIKAIEETCECNGWILDGYPKTVECAKIFEDKLAGNKEKVREVSKSKLFDLSEGIEENTVSNDNCFNLVISLLVDDEEIFKRSCGEVYDKVGKKKYHLILDPPDDNVMLNIIQFEKFRSKKVHLNDYLVNFRKNIKSLEDLFSKYKYNYVKIDGNKNVEDVIKSIVPHFEKLLKKEKEDDNVVENEKNESKTDNNENSNFVMSIENAKFLENLWYDFEKYYCENATKAINQIKMKKEEIIQRLVCFKMEFSKLLKVKNDKISLINDFITFYNGIERDWRGEITIKNEVHIRLVELENKLSVFMNQRKDEAQDKLNEYRNESWIENNKNSIIQEYIQVIQLEVNKFINTAIFLTEYYFERNGIKTREEAKYKNIFTNMLPKSVEKSKTKVNDMIDFNAVIEKTKEIGDVFKLLLTSSSKKDKKKKKDNSTANLVTDTEFLKSIEFQKQIFLEKIDEIVKEKDNLITEMNGYIDHIISIFEKWTKMRSEIEFKRLNVILGKMKECIEKEIDVDNNLVSELL